MLGRAVRARRGERGQVEAGAEAGLPHSTLSRIERGTHRPSVETARALAVWLGWTLEQVLDAAETRVPFTSPD
jgi:DNA-binding XRE family transcriptional regulator